MSGWLSNGVPSANTFTGAETQSVDTNASNGSNPQTASITTAQQAILLDMLSNTLDKTMVDGSRYYSSINIGNPQVLTGIRAKVGGTGGTDLWIFELHGPTGLLLATTATAGTTAGTANTYQEIAFTATYNLTVPGTYFIAVQSNGTTAKLATLNAPSITGVYTGSATGTFGTGASITAPTTYTANLGPLATVY
jgi:hypothetical protein